MVLEDSVNGSGAIPALRRRRTRSGSLSTRVNLLYLLKHARLEMSLMTASFPVYLFSPEP